MTTTTEPLNAAYGGEGWSPRTAVLRQEIGRLWGSCGIDSEWRRLKQVLLHRPGDELLASQEDHNAVQMHEPLDLIKAQAQHDGIAAAYESLGVHVHYVDPAIQPTPNQMFCADLMFMTPEGVILARPASTVRAGEERWVARRLAEMGVPVIRSVRGGGTFEGADAMWLDEKTVIIGRGLRTNDEGAAQLVATLNEMDVEAIVLDLPFGTMHLMGMIRIVDQDLAIAWPKRLVHRGVEALKARGYRVAFFPEEQEGAQGSSFNFVTVGRREILAVGNNPNSIAFYEELGIKVHAVPVDELRKAAGAIGCLTGIVEREMG